MSDTKITELSLPNQFNPTEWNDSAEPALSAAQLNRLEAALVVLLGNNAGYGKIQELITNVNEINKITENLPETYAKYTHTHESKDITNFPTKLSSFENDTNYTIQGHNHTTGDLTDFSNQLKTVKTEILTQVENQQYITEIPEEYVTESELNSKGYVVAQDLNNYAKLKDIPDTSEFIKEIPSEYITESELEGKITEISGLNNYYKKNETIGIEDTVILCCGDSDTLID